MNVYASYSLVTESFTFSEAPDEGSVFADIYYEYDLLLSDGIAASEVTSTVYEVEISDEFTNSSGLYTVKWNYTVSGDARVAHSEFKIEDIYVSLQTFLNDFPEFDQPTFVDRFPMAEKTARRIIDTHTGQSFQFVHNKQREFYGNGKSELYLHDRLISFTSVILGGTDYTDKVSMDLRSRYYIKLLENPPFADSRVDDVVTPVFPKKTLVQVSGDWGWVSVPWEIEQAAELLIVDMLDDTRREHHRYGINRLEQGNNRLEFNQGILNSTGNIDVDTLLMDYVHWTMDYVF